MPSRSTHLGGLVAGALMLLAFVAAAVTVATGAPARPPVPPPPVAAEASAGAALLDAREDDGLRFVRAGGWREGREGHR